MLSSNFLYSSIFSFQLQEFASVILKNYLTNSVIFSHPILPSNLLLSKLHWTQYVFPRRFKLIKSVNDGTKRSTELVNPVNCEFSKCQDSPTDPIVVRHDELAVSRHAVNLQSWLKSFFSLDHHHSSFFTILYVKNAQSFFSQILDMFLHLRKARTGSIWPSKRPLTGVDVMIIFFPPFLRTIMWKCGHKKIVLIHFPDFLCFVLSHPVSLVGVCLSTIIFFIFNESKVVEEYNMRKNRFSGRDSHVGLRNKNENRGKENGPSVFHEITVAASYFDGRWMWKFMKKITYFECLLVFICKLVEIFVERNLIWWLNLSR